MVEAKTEDTKSALERPLAANRAEKSPYPSFAQPEQRWLPGAACRACKIAIEAPRPILQSYGFYANATLSFVGSNNDTYHLRRFFDDACFFLFSPENLCRGFSSTASSSS